MDGAHIAERLSPHHWRIAKHDRMVADVRGIGDSASESGPLLKQLIHLASLPGVVDSVVALPGARHGELSPEGVVFAANPDEGGVVVPSAMGDRLGAGVLAVHITAPNGVSREGGRSLSRAMHLSNFSEPMLGRPWQRREVMKMMHHGLRGVSVIDEGAVAGVDNLISKPFVGADPGVLSEATRMAAERHLGMLSSSERITVLRGAGENDLIAMISGGQAALPAELQRTARRVMSRAAARHSLKLPNPEVRCAPVHSHEGREYLAGMAAVMNFARSNRALIAQRFLGQLAREWDVPHASLQPTLMGDYPAWSIRFEVREVEGKRHRLCVHRLGAMECDEDRADTYPVRIRDESENPWMLCRSHSAEAFHSLPAEVSTVAYTDREIEASGLGDVAAECEALGRPKQS